MYWYENFRRLLSRLEMLFSANYTYFLLNLVRHVQEVFLGRYPPGRPFAIGAVIIKSGHDVNMYMRDNLIRSYSVVLPHVEPIRLYCRYYCLRNCGH
jgi:hypothetical protein